MKPDAIATQKEILQQCRGIYTDKDVETTKDLKSLLGDIDFLNSSTSNSGWRIRNNFLYTALSVAYALYSCRKKSKVMTYLAEYETRKPRSDGNQAVRFIKLCLPKYDRRSLSRFGKVLPIAKKQQISPKELYETLLSSGGVQNFLQKNDFRDGNDALK